MKVGDVHETVKSGKLAITNIKNKSNVDVVFIDTGYRKTTTYKRVILGNIKDPYARSVFGVGFISEGKYKPSYKGKVTSEYVSWSNMLSRCYNEKIKTKKYAECTVCDEWHNFQNFAKWHEDNHPKDGKKYYLDKDYIKINNKVYSPESCMFISGIVNSFMSDSESARGEYAIGVHMHKRSMKITANCNNPITGRMEYLGSYNTEMEAHIAWRNRKIELCSDLSDISDSNNDKLALSNYKEALESFMIHNTK
ncbi:hypothetical protein NVP1186O_46 [Vibrio phage 1.186.O._10N.286.49.E3]|nr:hypothetical protein NVP1186O_46 [Vibrio phage 1.186.O._10N.286.49.E3]